MSIYICHTKCSTCKNALKNLKSKNIDVKIRDIVNDKLSKNELEEIYLKSKLDIKKLFNTSGNKYKELNLKDKLDLMTIDEKLELLASDGMLVKRPILIHKDKVYIGYKKEIYENL